MFEIYLFIYSFITLRASCGAVYCNRLWVCGCVCGSVTTITTGVGSGGYAGDLTPQLFMWGY